MLCYCILYYTRVTLNLQSWVRTPYVGCPYMHPDVQQYPHISSPSKNQYPASGNDLSSLREYCPPKDTGFSPRQKITRYRPSCRPPSVVYLLAVAPLRAFPEAWRSVIGTRAVRPLLHGSFPLIPSEVLPAVRFAVSYSTQPFSAPRAASPIGQAFERSV